MILIDTSEINILKSSFEILFWVNQAMMGN